MGTLNGSGKIEFGVCVKNLKKREIKDVLKDVFPEMILNERGNLILDIREDPVNTKLLIVEKLCCLSSEVIWLDGGFTDEQLTAMI
jgi:hypothetical protein